MQALLDGHDVPLPAPDTTRDAVGQKLHITLRRVEMVAVKNAATTEGATLAGWVAALIRARLKNRPVFSREELEALSVACLQLAAVGRNLNSAVHRLHKEGRWYEESVDLAVLGESVQTVTDKMNRVIARAAERGRF